MGVSEFRMILWQKSKSLIGIFRSSSGYFREDEFKGNENGVRQDI